MDGMRMCDRCRVWTKQEFVICEECSAIVCPDCMYSGMTCQKCYDTEKRRATLDEAIKRVEAGPRDKVDPRVSIDEVIEILTKMRDEP